MSRRVISDLDAGAPQIDVGAVERVVARVNRARPVLVVLLGNHVDDDTGRLPERPALTLAGHTHAGQVDLPMLRRLCIPSRFGARYGDGHVVERPRHLLLSNGVGTSGWPVRLGARPEVLLVRLRRARVRE